MAECMCLRWCTCWIILSNGAEVQTDSNFCIARCAEFRTPATHSSVAPSVMHRPVCQVIVRPLDQLFLFRFPTVSLKAYLRGLRPADFLDTSCGPQMDPLFKAVLGSLSRFVRSLRTAIFVTSMLFAFGGAFQRCHFHLLLRRGDPRVHGLHDALVRWLQRPIGCALASSPAPSVKVGGHRSAGSLRKTHTLHTTFKST